MPLLVIHKQPKLNYHLFAGENTSKGNKNSSLMRQTKVRNRKTPEPFLRGFAVTNRNPGANHS
jgi:hypothetical protein